MKKHRKPVPEWAINKIYAAISLINNEGDYDAGMALLCEVAGIKPVKIKTKPLQFHELKESSVYSHTDCVATDGRKVTTETRH